MGAQSAQDQIQAEGPGAPVQKLHIPPGTDRATIRLRAHDPNGDRCADRVSDRRKGW